jgi:methyltransferase (TIGR00027 family)
MKTGIPSITALAVSVLRGVASDPRDPQEPVDPLAADLLPKPIGVGVHVLRRAVGGRPWLEAAADVASFGLVSHLRLRTLAIDAGVRSGLAAGVRQIVILGAGADARAERLPELASCSVFEVDHPDTQRLKARHAQATGHRAWKADAAAGGVRFVGVDFERDDLGERLAAAGHDLAQSTCWLWEGVTMYLSDAAVAATLATMRTRSATGSMAWITYATPDLGRVMPGPVALARPLFNTIGEPLRGLRTPDDAAQLLTGAGFAVASDTGVLDWARQFGGPRPWRVVPERLLEARADGPATAA